MDIVFHWWSDRDKIDKTWGKKIELDEGLVMVRVSSSDRYGYGLMQEVGSLFMWKHVQQHSRPLILLSQCLNVFNYVFFNFTTLYYDNIKLQH